jgi:hypothetical protein
MSTDMITGRGGCLQYAPDDSYGRDEHEGMLQCDRCSRWIREEDEVVLECIPEKMYLSVCPDCLENHYDFYLDDFHYRKI